MTLLKQKFSLETQKRIFCSLFQKNKEDKKKMNPTIGFSPFREGSSAQLGSSLGVHSHPKSGITYGHMFVGVRKCPWCP